MKRLWIALTLFALHAVCGAITTSLPPAQISLAGDGSVRTFSEGSEGVTVTGDGSVRTWRVASFSFNGATFDGLSFTFDSDPFIAFSVGVINNADAPLNFSFAFTSPYVDGPYNHLSSSFTADVQSQGTGATLSLMSLDSAVNGIVELHTTLPDCTDPGAADCGTATGSKSLSPTGPDGSFSTELKFTLGVRDTAQLSGRTDLTLDDGTPLPLPSTLALTALALASALGRRRTR